MVKFPLQLTCTTAQVCKVLSYLQTLSAQNVQKTDMGVSTTGPQSNSAQRNHPKGTRPIFSMLPASDVRWGGAVKNTPAAWQTPEVVHRACRTENRHVSGGNYQTHSTNERGKERAALPEFCPAPARNGNSFAGGGSHHHCHHHQLSQI